MIQSESSDLTSILIFEIQIQIEFDNIYSQTFVLNCLDVNNLTYDVWNFVLVVGEPMFRPLVWLSFYLTFLLDNDNVF